jgi:hypothetical protein
MATLRSEVRPGDALELRLDSGITLAGELDRILVPDDTVRLRVEDPLRDRFHTDVRLQDVEQCVLVRTEGNLAFPVGGAVLLGAVGAGIGSAFDHALGDDSPGGAAGIVIPFALVGALTGVIVGALVMPAKRSERTLWP